MARTNWSYMLLAFVMSVSLWYMVVGQARVEQPITLRIEYSGMPSDLVIKKGLVQDITIQLRGPRALIRTASDSRYTYTVDLSNIKKGMNTVPLTTKDLPFTRAFEVVDMNPSRLTLEVDSLVERVIGVDVHMRDGLPTGVDVEHFSWEPESVTVRGPETVVSEILRLHAEVPPPAQSSSRRIATQASIVVPPLVEAMPVQVDVTYYANVAMREMVLTRTLNHAVNLEHFSVTPHQVSVRVSVPELDADDEAVLQAITAYFEVPEEASYAFERYNILGTPSETSVNSVDVDGENILSAPLMSDTVPTIMASETLATIPSTEPSTVPTTVLTDAPSLDATLSPLDGDLASPMPNADVDELPAFAELPEVPDNALIFSDVDEALTDALRESSRASEQSGAFGSSGEIFEVSSGLMELVLTTVPVRISAPSNVKILEITPPEIELMLR
ncbi:MAG: CdaR family protein [Pseudomonadota bacterium]